MQHTMHYEQRLRIPEALFTSSGSLVVAAGYSIVVSKEDWACEAAQRLRYEVFRSEPGFALQESDSERDIDPFDDYCEQLIVREDSTGEIVGCYRLLSPASRRAGSGLYMETEFELAGFGRVSESLVEAGRACVRQDHRNGVVVAMMWAALLRYIWLGGHRYLLGCVSVPMDFPQGIPRASNVRAVHDLCAKKYQGAPDLQAVPKTPVSVNGLRLYDIEPAPRPVIPPLFQGYMRIGARVCGEPFFDPAFDVADFPVLIGLHEVNGRYLRKLAHMAGLKEGELNNLESLIRVIALDPSKN